jgi:hypothetical protein
MNDLEHQRIGWKKGSAMVLAVLSAFGWLSLSGCAEDPERPTPAKEIKSDSDRMFEKMKQEERERGAEPGRPTR